MTTDQLRNFFEENDFLVHQFEQDGQQCAELERWTSGGVDMITTLIPFTKKEFISYVDNFDVDEEIDSYRMDKNYKNTFTIRHSLADFTEFHNMLKEISEKIKNKE